LDNMWNNMAGWPYNAMNSGGMNGYMPGDLPGYGPGHGYGPGPGPGPCPWDGYEPWMPPKKDMDCMAILRCIHRCMQGYMDHKPYEEPMAGYGSVGGYEIGPVAGYGWGQNAPSLPNTD
jgi:hypothetical protein